MKQQNPALPDDGRNPQPGKRPAPHPAGDMDEWRRRLPEISNVASVSECTGLMQSIPHTEEEAASYRALSSMEIPREPEADK